MSELNNLIPISYDNPERPTVSGRELHDFLEVTTRYNDWFNRMTEYGFTEGEDYYSFLSNRSDGLAGKPRTDHQLTIPMAKELCMIQRNERGKQARQYFLAVEAQWNSPEAVMRRAVLIAQKQNDQLKAVNKQLLAENNDLKPDAAHGPVYDAGLIFVQPRMIPIHVNGEITDCQRPLRAQTAQGERVSLANSEEIPAGSSCEFDVTLLDDSHEKVVREWLDYGILRGIGQWRNSGKGRFTYTAYEVKD